MSAEVLKTVLDAFPLPALAVDSSERIVAGNAAAFALFGDKIRGHNYITILRQPALIDAVDAALGDGASRQARFFADDGAQKTLYQAHIRHLPVFAALAKRVVILSFVDISHLEFAGQMRRDFVANVSHELRTPLTALIGFIETLRGPARDDAAAIQRFLDIMQAEAERMNRLIGDLLSLSRLEGEERVRPTARIELVEYLHSVCRSLGPLAREANVEIECDFETETVELIADPDQLTQVFTNLVENAIKYGGAGGKVLLRLRISNREAVLRAPGVRVSVIDYGPGIAAEHLPRLTERFYRIDDHRSREAGGTGLGLAIVKHIINRHRGRLRIDSTQGEGAVFTVILPLGKTSQARP